MKWIINGNSFVNNVSSPKTFFLEDFTPRTVRAFSSTVTDALTLGQEVLPIYIESSGGDIYSLNGMLSVMDAARKNGLQLATIVAGQAMSAGAYVFCYGDKGLRFAGSSATIMIHGMQLGGINGNLGDVKSLVDNLNNSEHSFFEKISSHLGKRKDWLVKNLSKRKDCDWFLTPEEAKVEGIVNHIHIPTFRVDIKAEILIV
jgi:ATP-dependent protease ClpP protease subunit